MATWSEEGWIHVGRSGSCEELPRGELRWAKVVEFEGVIGPMPVDREFPRVHNIDGRASEHAHEWWGLPKLRHLTLRYTSPEQVGQLAGYRGEWTREGILISTRSIPGQVNLT